MRRTASRLLGSATRWAIDAVTGTGLAQGDATPSHEAPRKDEGSVDARLVRLARQAAADGCVLLRNDGTLPLSADDEVAVFGRCQVDWMHMGYGSGGGVRAPYLVGLLDGLEAAGVRHNRVLAHMYRSWCSSDEHAADPGWWGHWQRCHPEMPVSDDLARAAAKSAHTAVVVLGRVAGEDCDNTAAAGGYYPTADERELVRAVADAFGRVVVVLDVGNVVDLSWLNAYGRRISAVLACWLGGMEAGNAVADVLYGKVNPSGRLAATFAHDYADYPSSASFGDRRRVCYEEGVFVGYRHFLTHAPERVRHAFGFGLSYTSFRVRPTGQAARDDHGIRLAVRVTNTGRMRGREVVQLWCEPPQAGVERPRRVLVAFAKTGQLDPGATELVPLAAGLKELARYDEDDDAWVLDAGAYRLVANDADAGTLVIDDKVVLERCHEVCSPKVDLRERILAHMPRPLDLVRERRLTLANVREGEATLDELVAQMGDDELADLTCGEGMMNSSLGPRGNAGALGGVTRRLRERGVPPVICADGPSGLRVAQRHALLPCATALACTWDVGLVEELYGLLGDEVRAAGVDVLLAPGMNIQRDPLCGRNFEYFSEDPLLTGKMAAAVVRGLQGRGVSACPKHLACNNQELRRNTCDSVVSQRALREIYLRGFETCVREARPDLVMTSYNKVNGVWSHYSFDLATTVLRDEWGFSGTVITDWWMQRARSPEFARLRDNAYRVRAQVDVLMPGYLSRTLPVRTPPRGVTRAELERSARNVLALALKHMPEGQPEG